MHIPHELPDEFPDETVLIARLRKPIICSSDWRAVTTKPIVRSFASSWGDERTADEVLEKFKRERLKLKDKVTRMLTWGRASNVGSRRGVRMRQEASLAS